MNWRELAELVGVLAIVASLVFVGLEMRQSREIAIGEGNLANAAIQMERNNAIIENSDVWVRGNSAEYLNDAESVVFEYLVRNAHIHAFMEHQRLQRLDFGQAATSVAMQFSLFLFQNPGAREVWIRIEASATPQTSPRADWIRQVRSNLAKLDENAAQE